MTQAGRGWCKQPCPRLNSSLAGAVATWPWRSSGLGGCWPALWPVVFVSRAWRMEAGLAAQTSSSVAHGYGYIRQKQGLPPLTG
jgi:hypothetical protein